MRCRGRFCRTGSEHNPGMYHCDGLSLVKKFREEAWSLESHSKTKSEKQHLYLEACRWTGVFWGCGFGWSIISTVTFVGRPSRSAERVICSYKQKKRLK